MDNFKELPLEVRLSAYIDGQLSEEDAREIEALLASDPHARELLDALNAGSDFGNQAFAEMLKEPVPLHLVRTIKGSPSGSGAVTPKAANSNVVSFFRFVPQAIAASAVLLLAGGYTGYFIGMKNAADIPAEISETTAFEAPASADGVKTRGFTFEAPMEVASAETGVSKADVALMEIAGLHKVYVGDKTHADEVPAAQESELIGWLEAVTSVKFSIPDLASEGLKLRGGKLVVAVGQPTGALFYEDGAGKVAAVYFMKNVDISGAAPQQDGFSVVGGQKDATSYFIAAEDEALARKLEDKVRAAL